MRRSATSWSRVSWSRRLRRVSPLTTLALGTAFGLFALTFRGERRRFWERMTVTGFVLGNLALANEPELRRMRPRGRDVLLGLGSAALLYWIFQIGDRMARAVMPRGAKEIRDIYELRTLGAPEEIGARLATVIGPAEELFWRGFLQRRAGGVAAAAAYGGAHLVTGNTTLVGAATVAGIYWGILRALGMSMPALITSHIAWDIWIFLLSPTEGAAANADEAVASKTAR